MEFLDMWNRFMAGDDDAYASLYEEYVQDLYQYGLCFTSDTELVKDCIHFSYLQPIITQYFIDNKSEIWLLFLIAHSKR